MSDKIVMRYIGKGSWLPGVPSRDLTAKDMQTYGEAVETHLRAPGESIWERVEASKPKNNKDSESEED